MPGSPEFAYVQARLQARHGMRPDAATWSRLESALDVQGLLHVTRTTSLAPWTDALRRAADLNALERSLRLAWFEYVAMVAGWSPLRWRDAVRWIGTLSLLPSLQHLLAGGAAPEWMNGDPGLAPALQRRSDTSVAYFRRLPIASLYDARSNSLLGAWISIARSLWPRCTERERRSLEQLSDLAAAQRLEIVAMDDESSSADALAGFADGLRRLFRRGAHSPVAIFAHLGLVALDLQRLRGSLAMRALFPGQPELHRWQ